MRRFEDSTFLFISTNRSHGPSGVEHLWLEIMRELQRKGATVRFLCLPGSATEKDARESGIQVDPYTLGKLNLVSSHTRLRHYLSRYQPVCAHSTGLEGDFLLRWAARRTPDVRIVHTVTADAQATVRRRPVEAAMRRLDEWGMRSAADAVIVDTEETAAEVRRAGVPDSKVVVDDMSGGCARSVARCISLYKSFMAERGAGR